MANRLTRSRKHQETLRLILAQPQLPQIIQSLDTRLVSQLVSRVGVEDAGEILALTTSEQLKDIFAEQLWQEKDSGEGFSSGRLMEWLEVMADSNLAHLAESLAEMGEEFVAFGLMATLSVFDLEEVAIRSLGGAHPSEGGYVIDKMLSNAIEREFDGYVVLAFHQEHWNILEPLLVEMDSSHHEFLVRLLARLCAFTGDEISQEGDLPSFLSLKEQAHEDAAGERYERRASQGYIAARDALVYLNQCRLTALVELKERRDYERLSAYHLKAFGKGSTGPMAASQPASTPASSAASSSAQVITGLIAELITGMGEEGENASSRQALRLTAGPETAKPLLFRQAFSALAEEGDLQRYEAIAQELTFLGNCLLAGTSWGGRKLRIYEAAEGVVACANLGLEALLTDLSQAPTPEAARIMLQQNRSTNLFAIGWHLIHQRGGEAAWLAIQGLSCQKKLPMDHLAQEALSKLGCWRYPELLKKLVQEDSALTLSGLDLAFTPQASIVLKALLAPFPGFACLLDEGQGGTHLRVDQRYIAQLTELEQIDALVADLSHYLRGKD